MKNLRLTFLTFIVFIHCTFTCSFGQDILGKWSGVLDVPGKSLRIVINIDTIGQGYKATMESPDQGGPIMELTEITFKENHLMFIFPKFKIEYNGDFINNKIEGTFSQSGHDFPLIFSRGLIEKKTNSRPQEPRSPYSYNVEDVQFKNAKANINLAGTLTLPKEGNQFPVVVLISGSGPQNRNEELLGHKPFLVLSDFLTKNGIAVLRYDDRGVGKSEGKFETATTHDFAADAEAAIVYLKTRKDINIKKIGLIGHSEGGIIAPIIASRSKDVAFIVMMAGTGLPGNEILLEQYKLIGQARGVDVSEMQDDLSVNKQAFDMIKKSKDVNQLKSDLTVFFTLEFDKDKNMSLPEGVSKEMFIQEQINQLTSPWMINFIKYDPAQALKKTKCPVLAIIGQNDLQVPAGSNLSAIQKWLKKAGNKDATVKELPGLNHLFQESKTGSPDEYANIEQTISPIALYEIEQWIKLRVK